MTHVSLFSGFGGFDLAAEWAGFTTVLFVEKDEYCQKVLRRHWPGVPIIGDIRDVNEARLADAMQPCNGEETDYHETTRQKGDRPSSGARRPSGAPRITCGTRLPSIDLVTGGFPCQPVSHAGKRRGTADDRWLWPEMLRVVDLIRPRWVVAENTPGLGTMGQLDTPAQMGETAGEDVEAFGGDDLALVERCRDDLAALGYDVAPPILFPARAVWAWHLRQRVFIVAHAEGVTRRAGLCECGPTGWDELGDSSARLPDSARGGLQERGLSVRPRGPQPAATDADGPCKGFPDAEGFGVQGLRTAGVCVASSSSAERIPAGRGCPDGAVQWAVEPGLGRLADGVSNRVDRVRGLGNAVVPQQAYRILRGVADQLQRAEED